MVSLLWVEYSICVGEGMTALLKRKIPMLLAACCLLLAAGQAWAVDEGSLQDKVYSPSNGGFTVSALDLHEICKEDLEESDFSKTRCGMYMQGAVGAYIAGLVALVGEYDEKMQREIGFRLSGCKKENGSSDVDIIFFDIKNVATGFVKTVDQLIAKNKSQELAREPTNWVIWGHLFSCGTGKEFSVETFKNKTEEK